MAFKDDIETRRSFRDVCPVCVHEPNYLFLILVRFSVLQLRVVDDIRVLYSGEHILD